MILVKYFNTDYCLLGSGIWLGEGHGVLQTSFQVTLMIQGFYGNSLINNNGITLVRTSVAGTLVARLPWLFRTRSWVP